MNDRELLSARLAQLECSHRRWRRGAICLVALAALAFVGWAPLTDTAESNGLGGNSEGDQPYHPTRLEWLYLRANATMKLDAWDKDGFGISFSSAGRGSNAITIVVSYDPKRVDRVAMNKEIDFARKTLYTMAKGSGWDAWFRVQEKLIPIGG